MQDTAAQMTKASTSVIGSGGCNLGSLVARLVLNYPRHYLASTLHFHSFLSTMRGQQGELQLNDKAEWVNLNHSKKSKVPLSLQAPT